MFEVANPWILLILPIPFLIRIKSAAKMVFDQALKLPFYDELIKKLNIRSSSSSSFRTFLFWFVLWSLLVVAAAGPRWVGIPDHQDKEGHNIFLAIDLSGSMDIPDMLLQGKPVSRLSSVKRAAEQFIKARKDDELGLILFGTQAYLQTPLTFDHQNILMRLSEATVGLAGQTTSIGDAIGLAVKRFEQAPKKGRVLILLTDGVNNSGVLSPLKAAELAAASSIKIYTIGLGGEIQLPLNGLFFNSNVAELDEVTLKVIAQKTGGLFFRAVDPASLNAIYDKINQLERVKQQPSLLSIKKEYYPWLLIGALAMLMGWFGKDRFFLITKRNFLFKEQRE